MAERCRLCGATVRVADAAHVMLNAPDAAVEDCYVCADCFEASVAPLFAGDGEGNRGGDEAEPTGGQDADAVAPE
jgi:hypothetical protein